MSYLRMRCTVCDKVFEQRLYEAWDGVWAIRLFPPAYQPDSEGFEEIAEHEHNSWEIAE